MIHDSVPIDELIANKAYEKLAVNTCTQHLTFYQHPLQDLTQHSTGIAMALPTFSNNPHQSRIIVNSIHHGLTKILPADSVFVNCPDFTANFGLRGAQHLTASLCNRKQKKHRDTSSSPPLLTLSTNSPNTSSVQ
mmetsp:Transcript_3198/g.4797  ORF Transcript_3198/g.4797 Transcript_3198/m.4797 type:complete len:135 (-) Transcript_3198:852-1256(-)|eukprot:CAMPEP_0195511398 /NCGR_PEP_ID=MMETSP0794_2-20130614/3728_1 /TAXON_ID=515487 /ORGANISM="Stephanopyxis turris, Strain CCMP 815" /LENGTH=134 /DNA_ID=CAMNT_0040638983 /DNA_START=1441 /DNA_END=1845 /DNA_ORIENTATION=-